jgi:glycosyltransferase involved in cell wall biosynthesis
MPNSQLDQIKVSVAIATYNGEKYLADQLDSIYQQTHNNLEVVVSDDGSEDNTIAILKNYKNRHGLLYTANGENLRVAKNFEKAVSLCTAPYIALSDQDDVWLPQKIEKSLLKIVELEARYGQDTPLLVFTDLVVADQRLHTIHASLWAHLKIKPWCATFNRLLVENVITGCTILMNQALSKLAFPAPGEILMHDVWLGLVAACFGHADYIAEPTVLYRQHAGNIVGASFPSLWEKMQNLINRTNRNERFFFAELKQAESFKKKFHVLLSSTPKQNEILSNFIACKNTSFFHRKFIILKYRFFGNTIKRTINILVRF